jgi:beta-lactamase regulating signal transducer with metallopeptidase domain
MLLVWALGVGSFGICAWRDLRRARLLLRGCAAVSDPPLLQCAAELARSFRLSTVPSLMTTETISSPLLLAGAGPVIVLPSALASGSTLEQLRLMIAHEMAHLKRFDLWWVWLAVAGEALFFFHPLVWLARREWRLTQEMACDEMVVRLTRVSASTYGGMLVGVAARRPPHRLEPLLVTLGLTETKEMLARRLNAMKLIKFNSTKRMALATVTILVVSALGVLPWRLVAQSAPSTGATSPSPNSGQASGGGSGVSGRGGGFGGGGRAGFSSALAPVLPPTNVAPAHFEATIYELEVPENRIADLDALKLESAAATPQALAKALEVFGAPKILYKVDQNVNLYGETITLGTQEPLITGSRRGADEGTFNNSISYTTVGLLTRISAAAPPSDSKNANPNVQLNFQLSVVADSVVPISETANANRIRNVDLSQSGTPKFGKPSVLVTVNAADPGEKSRPVAYIVRYLFTQPQP